MIIRLETFFSHASVSSIECEKVGMQNVNKRPYGSEGNANLLLKETVQQDVTGLENGFKRSALVNFKTASLSFRFKGTTS
jgi:hypothetical protein